MPPLGAVGRPPADGGKILGATPCQKHLISIRENGLRSRFSGSRTPPRRGGWKMSTVQHFLSSKPSRSFNCVQNACKIQRRAGPDAGSSPTLLPARLPIQQPVGDLRPLLTSAPPQGAPWQSCRPALGSVVGCRCESWTERLVRHSVHR